MIHRAISDRAITGLDCIYTWQSPLCGIIIARACMVFEWCGSNGVYVNSLKWFGRENLIHDILTAFASGPVLVDH